ncbi:MAG: MBL fold metallo-hydrolase [Eubacterium sp.]|nr:MBL fold metallo-hydrolase [Eubacterium sp.]
MYKMSSVTTGLVATNCFTIINEDTKEAIMIDASGNPKHLLEDIVIAEAKPVAILLTHAHFDHIDAVDMIRSEFPDIEVIIGKNDEELMGNPNLNLSMAFMGDPVSVKADRTVNDGEVINLIGIRIECIEVPGHTKGGMCYYMPELSALFDGDTLFHGSVGRSDFPTGDSQLLLDSIRGKLFTLPDETKVFPGHDSETTIGWEKENNMFFQ